jgi:hypothetical protein
MQFQQKNKMVIIENDRVLRDVHDLCMVRALRRPIMFIKCAQDAWFMHDESLTT